MLYSIEEMIEILKIVNVSSIDDDYKMIDSTRIEVIADCLENSNYKMEYCGKLTFIYVHQNFDPSYPIILVSNHIDSLYNEHFMEKWNDEELLGTFDNSISNGVVLFSMLKEYLNPQVMVAFTANEESGMRGAKESILFFKEHDILKNLEMAIVMDITAEGYGEYEFTVENYSVKKRKKDENIIKFKNRKDFKKYAIKVFSPEQTLFIPVESAAPDESWVYREYNVNCFTLCIPTAPHPDNDDSDIGYWMHSDRGLLTQFNSIPKYGESLEIFTNALAKQWRNL